ncbi:MAG: hypothetical protein CW691_06525 [Candidatus Bathyarchaeum sp.]|nr:MAG: hypothetical protein CW691_06525 [Candidatus Bathyarchaeum sp.]
MNKKFSEKTHNKQFTPEILMQPTVSSDNPILFQIFFLSPDQNQSVEIVETDIIDFGEITQRVKSGESVFIKNKNQQTLESYYKNKEENQNFWYFTHC